MRLWLDRMSRAKDAASEDQVVRDLIETLLAHPAYGERWARHWLDVARYSEVGGWTQDNRSNPKAFHYRDWVIQAFNQDLPFSSIRLLPNRWRSPCKRDKRGHRLFFSRAQLRIRWG